MRLLALLLVAASAEAQPRFDRFTSRTDQGRTERGLLANGLAAFEALPASGAGVPVACAASGLTDARGVAVTAVRASNATCQSTAAGGMVSTGVANGELTVLGNGVPRIEFSRDGVRGVRVESLRVNPAWYSQELSNAYWSKGGSGVAVAVVTADYATAPDGTLTAERAQFAACPVSGNWSLVYRVAVDAAAIHTAAVYCKGTSADQSISICVYGGGGAASLCAPFVCPAASWREIPATSPATGAGILLGCDNEAYSGASNTGAADVLLWGTGFELGSITTSHIPTAGASATRNADVVSFPVTLSGTTFSAAINYDAPSVLSTGATAFQVYVDANNSVTASVSAAGKLTCTFRIGGVDSTVDSAGALTVSAVNRVACQYGATGRSACLGGTCTTTAGALVMPTGAATYYLGTRAATGNEANGVLSRACYDPADARCV